MYSTPLRAFVDPVPVCACTASLEAVLEIFSQNNCERVVVVDQTHYPLGVVALHRLTPYLELTRRFASSAEAQTYKRALQQPLSELLEQNFAAIAPLTVLQADLAIEQFWSALPTLNSDCHALVDTDRTFLGLLNHARLLQFLAAAGKPTPHSVLQVPSFLRLVVEPAVRSETDSPDRFLDALVQFVEQMPLPFMLQTGKGQVLSQNQSWRQQVAQLSDPARVRQDVSQVLDLKTLEFSQRHPTSTGIEIESGTVVVERVMKASAPFNPVTLLNQPIAPAAVSRTCHPGLQPNTCVCACLTKSAQEQIWHFTRIPLGFVLLNARLAPTLPLLLNQRSPGATLPFELAALQVDAAALHSYDASKLLAQEETLWLVLAQDQTEQQQVARELAAKNADLVQLNRLKDEFLACISHELRTPLTAVLGLSSLLKEPILGNLNERQARYARLIHQSGRHLMTIVNDILDLAHMETGHLDLTLGPVNISMVCDRAIELARELRITYDKAQEDSSPADPALEIPIVLEIAPHLESIMADELRLRQMLVHLLSNALKFTETGGEVRLQVAPWEGWIAFTVSDTGIGIAADKQHLIFQKFQQLENPMTRRFEGAGLGLVLTQRLARLHGGDITFVSKEGQGSQFTLLLPPMPPQAKISESSVAAARITEQAAASSKRLVLIIEAVPRFIEELSEQLSRLGYRVAIARSGTEALEKVRRLQPCTVFLNPLLPLLSGWDVLTLLKSDPETQHIPIIVTATRAEQDQAHQHRANGFLCLPIEQTALREGLARLNLEFREQARSPKQANGLTLLHLNLESTQAEVRTLAPLPPATKLTPELRQLLQLQHHRIVEADDLDQAELLARVWKPHVVLLDGVLPDPLPYFEHLQQCSFLASLPLVTLAEATTQVANRVPGLAVFPCLVSPDANVAEALLQAIQVAVGFDWQPCILIADLLTLPDLTHFYHDALATAPNYKMAEPWQEGDGSRVPLIASRPKLIAQQDSQSLVPSTPRSNQWLQASIQYLQTAGFRGLLSHSWAEVLQQLQHHSTDLLVLCLEDTEHQAVVLKAIEALQNLETKPAILVIDNRYQPTLQVTALLQAIAVRILPATVAIEELLVQIRQVLESR